jgi:hypothetical protein
MRYSLPNLTFEVKFIILPFQIIFPVPDFRCPSLILQYGTLQSHPPTRDWEKQEKREWTGGGTSRDGKREKG